MESVDYINKKWGRDTIKLAAMGVEESLKMRQNRKSPRYTTSWEEMLVAKV
jgi:DNA polymerase V